MKGMTGYGRYSVENDGREMLIELKAVNHRFLDLNIKLPRSHNFADAIIRNSIKGKIIRGHIDVYVTYKDNREQKYHVSCDELLAKSYLDMSDSLSDKYKINNDFDVACLMKSSDVVIISPIEDDIDIITDMYEECIDNAIRCLNESRFKEGQALKDEMLVRADNIKKALVVIRDRAPLIAAEYRDKLRLRVQEALDDVTVDEARLVNEVAFFCDKTAIDEEISRLDMHLINFNDLTNLAEPTGRKLDFLVQEMNRESNTIGSKANDIRLVNQVLAIKAEIEKIREQIQNIE